MNLTEAEHSLYFEQFRLEEIVHNTSTFIWSSVVCHIV